jgi:hypothetical protein
VALLCLALVGCLLQKQKEFLIFHFAERNKCFGTDIPMASYKKTAVLHGERIGVELKDRQKGESSTDQQK